jgi:hypothetical protein
MQTNFTSSVPVYISTFNNPTYLENFINQLESNGVKNIKIVDNNSTFPRMKQLLESIKHKYEVIRLDKNFGPHYLLRIKSVYESLPEFFCLSDPDLEFSKNLPKDFINELKIVSKNHKIGKVGVALEVPKIEDVLHRDMFLDGKKIDIIEYELQFWNNCIGKNQTGDDLYSTTLDTQFALYNKNYFNPADRYRSIRVAGKFTTKHLGQLRDSIVPSDEIDFYKSSSRYSYFGGKLNSDSEPSFDITVLEYTKMTELIESLKENVNNLDSKVQEQNRIIQSIFASKRWKLISRVLKLFGR